MRKIEEAMLYAIRNRLSWRKDNTEVEVTRGGEARVFLHGNYLARILPNGDLDINLATVRRWPTRTTMSRLRALGVEAYIKNGRVYLEDQRTEHTDAEWLGTTGNTERFLWKGGPVNA